MQDTAPEDTRPAADRADGPAGGPVDGSRPRAAELPAATAISRFSVGSAIAIGLKLWSRHLGPFLAIPAAIYAPIWLRVVFRSDGEHTSRNLHSADEAMAFALLISTPLALVVMAVLAHGAITALGGRRATIGAWLAYAAKRLPAAAGTVCLAYLWIGLAGLALVIPGFIVMCMLYVAIPASVIECLGPGTALTRSIDLTVGCRVKIGALLLLQVTFQVALLIGTGILVRNLYAAANLDDVFAMIHWMCAAYYAVLVIGSSLSAVICTATYALLRADKEGGRDLGAIFE